MPNADPAADTGAPQLNERAFLAGEQPVNEMKTPSPPHPSARPIYTRPMSAHRLFTAGPRLLSTPARHVRAPSTVPKLQKCSASSGHPAGPAPDHQSGHAAGSPVNVIRKYRFDTMPQTSLQCFDVCISPEQAAMPEAESVSPKRNYLRCYYSDYLGQKPTEDRPNFADQEGHSIESDELQRWILQAHPRSRTETYPLYVLTKDVFRRIVDGKCQIINSTIGQLREQLHHTELSLQEVERAKRDSEHDAEKEKQRLREIIQRLEEQVGRSSGCDSDEFKSLLSRKAELETEVSALRKELKDEHIAHQKTREDADKNLKDKVRYRKDATAATLKQQEIAMKLSKAEALAASLQSAQGPADPVDAMDATKKCHCLKRLLTDDSIFSSDRWLEAVASSLALPPSQGCGRHFKREIVSRLFKPIWHAERKEEGGSSAVALIADLLSSEDQPVTIYDLLQECIRSEVAVDRMDEQASFVDFLGQNWFSEFETARDSTEKTAQMFANTWSEQQDHADGDENHIRLTREHVEKGLDVLGHTQLSAIRFMREAAGDRIFSLECMLKTMSKENGEDHAHTAVEDMLTLQMQDIRRALRPRGFYRSLVREDKRQQALFSFFRSFMDREFGGTGVGNFLSNEAIMKREDEEQHGFADPLSVIADLLGENRIDLMMFWARKMPGEAMSLAKQSTKDSSSQRRSLLRYATVMVSREKASFVAWRDEVELVKIEKKEEEERLRREQARQRKMKKPNMNNLNSYEGGKPVAVKTLGHQIASIYQAKAVSDDLMDSNGRPHVTMPEFLKNHFIREYGLKSIAVKNLANLAAGVRKEAKTSLRLRLFGTLTGMIEPEEFLDGKVDMMIVGLKALLSTNTIRVSLEHLERHEDSSDTITYKHLQVPIAKLAQATLAVFVSKYYFTDDDDLVVIDPTGEQPPVLHPKVVNELVALTVVGEDYVKDDLSDIGQGVPLEQRDQLVVDIDRWMDWLLKQYIDSRHNVETLFKQLYKQYDTNQDSCLDLSEFTELIRAVDEKKSDQTILEMYNMALDCSEEGDLILEDAFVYTALHFQMPFKREALKRNPAE